MLLIYKWYHIVGGLSRFFTKFFGMFIDSLNDADLENLQIEQSSSRKSEILTVIKIIEEEK